MLGRSRKRAVWVVGLCVLTAGCRGPAAPHEELALALTPRPGANLIVISFDALRRDGLGVYGNPRETSPRLDAFAAESVVFDRAYSVAPVTPTSFASAFTGLLPTRVFHRWKMVHPETLASRLQQHGYRTGAVLNNVQLSVERHFDVGFESYQVLQGASDEEVVEKTLDWLGQHADERLFGWFHFISPHSPYDYREMAKSLYRDGYEGRFETTSTARFETEDPSEIERLKDLYQGEILYGDALFGRLIDGLAELELLERSFVVVTSDHGEEFFEHGGFQHDRLTEEHVRVPLLIRHPDRPQGLRSPLLVSNVDLLPTFMSLLGLDFDETVDGRDLTALDSAPERVVGVSMTGGKKRWLSLRRGDIKLIQTCLPDRGWTLFDLAADPGERSPLASEALASELSEELATIVGGDPCQVMSDAVRGVAPQTGLDPDQIEALKALGYLGGG